MINAIIYKEFLKSYRIIILFLIILLSVAVNTYLDVSKAMSAINTTNAVLNITQMQRFNFNNINNICMLFAIGLGVVQFYPEVSSARIRLFLHLPMTHFKLITTLILIGLVFLCFVFLIIGSFYSILLNNYYPYEVFDAIYSKMLPYFLASILCYLTTMLVFLEPKVIRKVLYITISYFILKIYLALSQNGYFVSDVYDIVLVCIIAIYILMVYEVFTSYTKGYIK